LAEPSAAEGRCKGNSVFKAATRLRLFWPGWTVTLRLAYVKHRQSRSKWRALARASPVPRAA